jgi:hypothetical protein
VLSPRQNGPDVLLADIERPALAAGVERRDFGSYGVLAPPGAGSVLRLEPDEYRVLALIDRTRSVSELEAAGARPYGSCWETCGRRASQKKAPSLIPSA